MSDVIQEALFRHIWKSYQETIDGRQKHGDVNLLAEAAERMTWPGAPEIGLTIAQILRDQVVGNKVGASSKHYRNVREREIEGLARMHESQGMTAGESHDRIAGIYGMTVDAVRKVLERRTVDK